MNELGTLDEGTRVKVNAERSSPVMIEHERRATCWSSVASV